MHLFLVKQNSREFITVTLAILFIYLFKAKIVFAIARFARSYPCYLLFIAFIHSIRLFIVYYVVLLVYQLTDTYSGL